MVNLATDGSEAWLAEHLDTPMESRLKYTSLDAIVP